MMTRKKQQQFPLPPPSESGFTLIESLLAIIVVAILLTAIAPVIVLSTATRVQARRTELGTQAARTYLDGVRSGTITPPAIATTKPDQVPAPATGGFNCPIGANYCTSPTNGYCIDGDGGGCTKDSLKDMVVQGFGYHPAPAAANAANNGYLLGLRVYRADAFNESSLTKGTKQVSFTGGLGDRKAPVVEMTTEIPPSSPNFKSLCARLGCN